MRRAVTLYLALACVLTSTAYYWSTKRFATNEPTWCQQSGPTMGSTYRWQFALPPVAHERQQENVLTERLQRELARADDLWSTWHSQSQLSLFNQQPTTDWFEVDPDTVELVELAARLHEVDQRFDVTVLPLSELWGLRPTAKSASAPDRAAIDACLAHVGMDKIESRRQPPAVRKLDPKVKLDLSALAAGFVADRVARILVEQGCRDFYVEITGEIVVRGLNPQGKKWRIGIAQPIAGSTAIQARLQLTNIALATSGNYRQNIQIGEQRLGHILDPTTGYPAQSDILSATVLNESCAWADAISTLLMTHSSSAAMELANRQDWSVLLLIQQPDGSIGQMRSSTFPSDADP